MVQIEFFPEIKQRLTEVMSASKSTIYESVPALWAINRLATAIALEETTPG